MYALALIALLAAPDTGAAPQPAKDAAAIIGAWTGAATCMVGTTDPECRNGQVTFTFAAIAKMPLKLRCRITRPGTTVSEPPADVEFTYDPVAKDWTGDYKTPFGSVRWDLRLAAGKVLSGYLMQQPLLHVNRRVTLTRVAAK